MQIVATGFGNPDVLEAVPSERRTPGKGEVTIAVRAAAVNPRDLKIYASRDYTRSLGLDTPKFPLQLGVEAAGIVIEAGPEAVGVEGPVVAGDEVIAYRINGAYADVITVSADRVVPKPPQLSWEQAGSIMLTGTTATHALAAVHARSGQTVLIHAAAGSVGLSAVQLAALDGINVIGTASEKDFDLLRKHGATPVRYGEGLLDRVRNAAPQGIDAALDCVGTEEAIDVSLQLVQNRSRIATIVAFDRAKRDHFLMIGGSAGQDPAGLVIRNAARLRLSGLAQAGAFNVRIAKSFPLAKAADAHRLLAEGGRSGHILLLP